MEFLTAICEVMADAVLVIDEARTVVFANRAATVRFGAPRTALEGGALRSVHPVMGPLLDALAEQESSSSAVDRVVVFPGGDDLLAFHLRAHVGGPYSLLTLGELEGPVLDRFLEQQQDAFWTARLHEATIAIARAGTANAVAEIAARIAMTGLRADQSIVTYFGDEGPLLEVCTSRGAPVGEVRIVRRAPEEESASGEVLGAGRPLWVERPEDFERRRGMLAADRLGAPGVRGLLPLAFEGKILGTIEVGFARFRPVVRSERQFAEGLAAQCAQVLARVRSVESERKAKRRLEILAGAAEVFARASHGRSEVLEAVARKVAESTSAGCIVRLRASNDTEQVAFHHPDAASRDALRKVLSEQSREISEDRRILAVLEVEGRPLGTLEMVRDDGSIDVDDRRLVEGLAELAAVAIENALLHEASDDARRRAEIAADRRARLQEITSSLSSATSLRAVADTTVAQCVRAIGGVGALLMVVDDHEGKLELIASSGLPPRLSKRWERLPLGGDHPAARAIREGRGIVYPDRTVLVEAHPDLATDLEPTAAWPAMLFLPLVGSARTLGVLGFQFVEEGTIPADDRRFLEAIGTQCAQAIERALLFASVERELAERRRAEEELASSTRLFESIAEASPDLLYLYDVEVRTVMYVNRSVERVLGISARDLQAFTPRELSNRLHPDDWTRVVDENRALGSWRDGDFLEHQFRMRHSSGEYRWLRSRHCVFLRMPSGLPKIILGVAQDVTEQKRAERERAELLTREKQARHEAEAASRAKDEFLAMLGHELRNPLAPIVTVLELMRLRGDDVLVRERHLMERQVQHLVRLVDDLLDVSRIIRGKTELRRKCVELFAVVAKAIEMASPLVEQRMHRLITSVPQKGLRVMADEHRLAQVVSNLLTNAAKYTEPGGKVMVTANTDAGFAVLRVRDNGIGLSPELLPRVFDLFVQGKRSADRSEGGLGLGLTIARQLIELHGGSVSASSGGHGQGSEFMVRLPLAENVTEPVPPVEAPEVPRRSPRATRILVVDDNQDAAELLAHALRSSGHEPRFAFDGPSAIEVARQFEPELALLDIGLPVMDGYEVARGLHDALRDRAPTMVAVSGYGQEADKRRSKEAGFAAHLVKPIALDELLRLIDHLTGAPMALASG